MQNDLFFKVSFLGVFLVSLPILALALWVGRQRHWTDPARAWNAVRMGRFIAWIFQFVILVFNTGIHSYAGHILELKWMTYVPLLMFFVALMIQAQICFSLEKELRAHFGTRSAATGLMLRSFFTLISVYFVYALFMSFSVFAFRYGAVSVFGETILADGLSLMGTPVGVFVGLLVVYTYSPYFVKMMYPTKELEDGELKNKIHDVFQRAKLPFIPISIIELEEFRFHNAMVAGMRVKDDGSGAQLFLTRSLIQVLDEKELEAVLFHEIAHLKLKHMKKRFLYAFFVVILSVVPVLGYYAILKTLAPDSFPYLGPIGAIAVALIFQVWLFRKQVRRHEFEADHAAVFDLGGTIEGIEGALGKLDKEQHSTGRKKDPMSFLNPASAHPTTFERVQALKDFEVKRQNKETDAA